MTFPLITVALPTYNRVGYLSETLLSAQQQTYPHLEILVGDNASTDCTESLVRAAGAKDKRIRYFRNSENVGMRNNWNLLLDKAKGEYCLLLSDDDILTIQALEKLHTCFNSEDIVLAYSRVRFIDSESRENGLSRTGPLIESGRDFIINSLTKYRDVYPSSVLFKTGLAKKFGGFPDVGATTDLALRLSLATLGNVCFLPDALVDYRIHEGCLSRDMDTLPRSLRELIKWSGSPHSPLYDYTELITIHYIDFLKRRALWAILSRDMSLLNNTVVKIKEISKYNNLRISILLCTFALSKLFSKIISQLFMKGSKEFIEEQSADQKGIFSGKFLQKFIYPYRSGHGRGIY